MKYTHTNIISNDWKKLAEFYVKTFGCKILPPIRKQSGDWLSKGTGVKNAKLEGAHLLLPGYGPKGPTLEIYQYEIVEEQKAVNPNKRGYGHLAFEVENVEEVLMDIKKNGGSEFGKLTSRVVKEVGKITFVYARDPEGNLIEIQKWEKESKK